MLYPAKKQLESNLRNHATSIKHLERVDAVDSKKPGGSAISLGMRGRPSQLGGSSNQKDLHRWLRSRTAKSKV